MRRASKYRVNTALLLLVTVFFSAASFITVVGQGEGFVFDPTQDPEDQGFLATPDSDTSMQLILGPLMSVIDSSTGAKRAFTYDYPGGIPDDFELQVRAGVNGAAGINMEDMGGVKDSGVRVGFTDGSYGYFACMIERSATRQIALLQSGGFSAGVTASWNNGPMDFTVRKTESGAELVVGDTTITVSNLALPPAGRQNRIEFGCYSGPATATALFEQIEEIKQEDAFPVGSVAAAGVALGAGALGLYKRKTTRN